MPSSDPRLIVALDLPTMREAQALTAQIGDAVSFYKIGLQLFASGGMDLAARLKADGHQIFLDWKLHDIGATVEKAAAALAGAGADLLTVHGEPQVMAAAVKGRGNSGLKILAVTVMTSLTDQDLAEMGYGLSATDLVQRRIGQALAKRARAFDMRVMGFDPFLSPERAAELGIELVPSVAGMLPQIDYLSVHTPLTEETRHLIGMPELDILKPGVRLINCARGGIYDEQALVEGLKRGVIAGVALDVFEKEPCTDSPLFGMPGVLVTPHLGASTEEAQSQVAVEGVGLLIDFLSTGAIRHSVNSSTIDPATLEGVRGFLDLAWRLGLLLSQLDDAPPRSCSIAYRGEIAARNTKLVTAAFAAGLLETAFDDVNIVNAEILLRERGIELVEQSRTDPGAFSSVVAVDLVAGDRVHRAAGTLFGHSMPRLVQLEGHRLEAYLDGILLVFTHQDVPGIIGRVGTAFGGLGVNIAQMTVGRSAPGGDAIGVLNLDHEPSASALEAVLACPGIRSVRVVKMPAAGQLPNWLAASASAARSVRSSPPVAGR
jgi:D-3-phosphoglycerate dehydrogenase